jgi:hypothetical protein
MKIQLIIIIISAFVGAFVKEFVGWLLPAVKPSTTRFFRFIRNPFIFELAYDLVLLGFATKFLYNSLTGPAQVVRADVFAIVLSVGFFLLAIYLFVQAIKRKIEDVLRKKNAELRAKIRKLQEQHVVLDAKLEELYLNKAQLKERLATAGLNDNKE